MPDVQRAIQGKEWNGKTWSGSKPARMHQRTTRTRDRSEHVLSKRVFKQIQRNEQFLDALEASTRHGETAMKPEMDDVCLVDLRFGCDVAEVFSVLRIGLGASKRGLEKG